MKISLPQFQAFVTLADCLSFTAAAERLHVTQPTLSATIRNLEELVGGRLFERDTRKVRLTALGQATRSLAQGVISEAERAEGEMREIAAGRSGVVRLAAQPQWFRGVLGPALSESRRRQPDIRLLLRDVDDEEAVALLRRGAVDMAVAPEILDGDDLTQVVVGEQTTVAVMPAGHALARSKTLRWKQLESHTLLVLADPGPLGQQFNRRLVEAGIQVSWSHRVRQVMTAICLVESGYGVAVMSNHSAYSLSSPGLKILALTHPRMARSLCLITRKGSETPPAARELHAAIVEQGTASRPAAVTN